MRYDFPQGILIDEVREAIAQHNERLGTPVFIEADRGDHVIFNYVVSFDGAFPFPNTGDAALDRQYAIIRECRGLTFHKETGRLLNRKFHKFFNVNEKPETQMGLIDWSEPHVILEKLDGSMITPMYLGDWDNINADELRWCTKMGLTDVAAPVEDWVAKNTHYARWTANLMYAGYTPMFEWCSRKQKIVVDYPQDRLVLTAVRNNHTGEYRSHADLLKAETHGIEVVKALPGSIKSIELFLEETRGLKGEEGYVIAFDDGRKYKVKAEEYCMLHKTKELIQFEKDVVALIAHDLIDDAKPFMDASDLERVEAFHRDYEAGIANTANKINIIVMTFRAEVGDDRKAFAQKVMANVMDAPIPEALLAKFDMNVREAYDRAKTFGTLPEGKFPADYQSILFRVNQGADAAEEVRKVIAKFAHPTAGTQTRINAIRHLFGGLRWDDYRDHSYVADEG